VDMRLQASRMRKMCSRANNSKSDSVRKSVEELAGRIADAVPRDGTREIQPGLYVGRISRPTGRLYISVPPSFCVIAQGSKNISLGESQFRYDPAHYLITTMELPLSGEVIDATPESPYLSCRLVLDSSVITSVMVEMGGIESSADGDVKAVGVSLLDADLLDATVRLMRLAESPSEYRVLAPLVTREIVFRLLLGAQGSRLQLLAKFAGNAHRMAHAIETIREQFNKPLRVEDVAKRLHMSVSGFHAHFKAVTAMSPLQFQKQLRLQEARRLMLSENLDAAQAGFQVGYEDASQFNREYKRHFGEPPIRNIMRLREFANAGVARSRP
jgi:AraC-like DNA-binding protein